MSHSYLKLEFHRENRTHRRHRGGKPDVEVTMCLGPMPPDASDYSGGIPALGFASLLRQLTICYRTNIRTQTHRGYVIYSSFMVNVVETGSLWSNQAIWRPAWCSSLFLPGLAPRVNDLALVLPDEGTFSFPKPWPAILVLHLSVPEPYNSRSRWLGNRKTQPCGVLTPPPIYT